jgi:hypothetical protein
VFPPVISIQLAFDVEFQLHDEADAVTSTDPLPPAESYEADEGDIE